MSKVMILSSCLARASACAPTTPPAGPGLDDVHRPLGGGRVGGQPAVRLHQQQARRNAGRVEPLAHRAQIGRDDRRHIGVDDRRRGALVFLDLGQHLERDAHRQAGRLADDDLLEHLLVRRIGEGVDQADRDRLDLLGEQRVDRALGVGGVERALDPARGDRRARRPPCADSARPAAPAWSRRGRRASASASVRISSTSRKPLVVIRPTRAPLCSRIALEATVVPWRISSMCGAAEPALAKHLAQAVDDRLRRSSRRSRRPSWCGWCRRSRAARCR